jgi:hypothetical protein
MSKQSAAASQMMLFQCVDLKEPFSRGDGSPEMPFEIRTEEELRAIGSRRSCHFVIMNSITLQRPLEVIHEFTGVIQGNGHEIECVSVMGAGGWIRVNNGRIENLRFVDPSITNSPKYFATGIIESNLGLIVNVHVQGGNVHSQHLWEQSMVGGIVGINAGFLEGCSFQGNVHSLKGNAGGIAGINDSNGRITDCAVLGSTVVGSAEGECVGGITGYSEGAIHLCRVERGVLLRLGAREYGNAGGIAGQIYRNGSVSCSRSSVQIEFSSPLKCIGSIVGVNRGAVIDVQVTHVIPSVEGCAVGLVIGMQTETGTLKGPRLVGPELDESEFSAEERQLLRTWIIGMNSGDKRGQAEKPQLTLIKNEKAKKALH